MISEEKIAQLIAQGENSALEFKRDGIAPDDLAKEIVGMLNREGGVILIGVEDDGNISGIEKTNEEWISNISRNNIIPAADLIATKVEIKDRYIFYLEVPKGKDKPYQTNKAQFIIRVGSTNRNATQQELLRLFQQAGVLHFDATPVTGTSPAALNQTALDQYFTPYGIDLSREENPQVLFRNTEILHETGELTVAGLLTFGINPQRYLHNACVSFAHFAGTEITDTLIDKQVIEGTLPNQVNTVLAIIKNNWRTPSIIEGLKTVPTDTVYEDRIFRELIVNACVHRNYSIHGSRIRIFLFDNRIEFRSPGRLPNSVSIEKLAYGVSHAPNPVIVKFMENLGYIDKLGRGLPMVVQAAKSKGKTVLFEEFGEEFIVTLFR